MKKTAVIITVYISLICLNNFIILPRNHQIIDQVNVFFLNISVFPLYQLEKINFQCVIKILFFFIFILNYLINDTHESLSFFNMVLYRTSKKNVIARMRNESLQKIGFLSAVTLISFLGIGFKLTGDFDISIMPIIIVYIIRFFVILFFLVSYYEIFALFGIPIKSVLIFVFAYIFLLSLDLFIESHLVTFSGIIIKEISYLLGWIVICQIGYLALRKKYLKTEDIL